MADIFLSYAREDQPRIEALVAAFQAQGWSVFWDRHIPAGQSWRSHIGQALRDAKCVVVVWSRNSISSHWVIEEAEEGLRRENLVPVLLEDVEVPIGFRGVQAGDLREWSPDHRSAQFSQLIHDIGALLRAAPQAPEDAPTERQVAPVPSEQPRASPVQPAKARSGRLNKLMVLGVVVAGIAGIGYWGYDLTRRPSAPQTDNKQSVTAGGGRVKSASGSFRFDKISGMSMGAGKLAITQFGSRVDIPLAKIERVQFLPDNAVRVRYLDGKSEEVAFSCYWNAPVTFHAGDKRFYYGDCAALRSIAEIEFFH